MARLNVLIVRPIFGDTLSVHFEQRNRQAVRAALVDLGGKEDTDHLVSGIPARHIARVHQVILEHYPEARIEEEDRRPHFNREGDKVAWSTITNRYGGKTRVGYIGRVKLFSVQSSYSRTEGQQYHLYTELPGYLPGTPVAVKSTIPEAQAAAEPLVEDFLSKLGAKFVG